MALIAFRTASSPLSTLRKAVHRQLWGLLLIRCDGVHSAVRKPCRRCYCVRTWLQTTRPGLTGFLQAPLLASQMWSSYTPSPPCSLWAVSLVTLSYAAQTSRHQDNRICCGTSWGSHIEKPSDSPTNQSCNGSGSMLYYSSSFLQKFITTQNIIYTVKKHTLHRKSILQSFPKRKYPCIMKGETIHTQSINISLFPIIKKWLTV